MFFWKLTRRGRIYGMHAHRSCSCTKTARKQKKSAKKKSNGSLLFKWIKEEELSLLENIKSFFGGFEIPKCEYDRNKLKLYKRYQKKEVPENFSQTLGLKGSKDLDLLEWYIIGKCPKCGNEEFVSGPDSYLRRGI